jgi:hypothetical protein
MKKVIMTPFEASQTKADESDLYAAYPLREWWLVKRMKEFSAADACGEMCSLRFTWQKPKKDASDEQTFLYQTLPWLLDLAWLLTDSALKTLHIERVPEKNNLFALAMFENEVAVEIEMNECLPDSMPATHFIKANFKHGHLTNQPLVGHFNDEGSILADASGMQRLVIENSDWDDCGDEIEVCRRSMELAIEKGEYPQGTLHSVEIINAIKEALS